VAANLSNGGVVLSAFDAALNQWQTWISNGTKAGTFEVTDAAGNPIQFTGLDTSLSGKLLFNASDAASGNQVWVTDGTQQGTMLLKDINSGFAEGFAYSSAFTLNNNLILLDAAGVNTPQDNLWLYNQTTAGYQQLTDTTGHALQSASDFTMLTSGAELFYAFDTGTNSWGNFITNGGAAVAFALIDSAGNEVRQDGGIAGDGFEVLTVYDPLNSLYYEFVSNGSQANTFQLGSGDNIYNPLYNVTNLTNGSLMFLAYGTAAGVNYISNGTRMGTFALTDASGNVLGASDESAALHNGSVIFSANDPVSNINGIFIDNGSQAKALQLTDVSGNVLEYVYSYYTALGNNSVIFNAIDSSTGQVSLYISNGSQAATSQLLDSSGNTLINAGEANAINGSVMFMAEDSVTRQTGLYITDGSQAGTLELLGADDSFFTVSALVSGSEIITIGNDPEWQPQTFISNGTPSGTFELKDSGGNSVSSPSLVSLGNGLELITAQDAINNQFQYFISNGSKAGTFQLASENAAPNHETALSNGTVIFAGYQYDIYASNGAQAGTFQLTDSKGQALTATSGFTNLDNAATIFAASDLTVSPYLELTGTGVYVSNGAQSVPLELTVDGNELSSAANFTAVGNGSVIFTANGLTTQISSGGAINYNYGTVDFISNGTQAGTFGLTDASGNALQNTTSFTSLANGGVIFSADDAATGAGVFVSDGSQAQALQLTDAAGHDLDTGNSGFISVGNGEVLFSATDAVTGREATYLSNGAQAGTFQFTDANGVAINGVSNVKVIGNGEFIFNFSYSSDPNPVSLSGGLSANGTIISVGGGNNASSSTEVGISDGAIAGTHILPAPGTASSNPGSFEPLTDNLTLTGTSSNYELIGGSGNDTLTSGVGHDVMYGGGGANSFVFGAGITPGADDFAYIMDYSDSQGDIINLSNVFTGQQPNSADIGNFVELVNNGGIVDIYVDATGGGNFTGHEVFELVNNASNNPIGLVGVQIAGQEFSLTA
jgi:ELWxxDGT repeat protein